MLGLPHAQLAALRAGCFVVVCDEAARNTPAFQRLIDEKDGLGIPPEQIFEQSDGADPPAELLAAVQRFVEEERVSEGFAEMCAGFAESSAALSDALLGLALMSKSLSQHASRASALLRINVPHVQIVSWTWTCNWEWPPFVLSLKEWVGGLIQIDINTVAKPECTTALRGGFASTATAFALMGLALLLGIGLGIKYRCAKRKAPWQAAAARAHIVSYGLALYTLAFPVLVKQAVRWLDWSPDGTRWRNNEVPNVTAAMTRDMQLAVALGLLWLLVIAVIVPVVCFRAMRRHREANRLHSAEVHARLGWLYNKYTDEAYWYELVSRALVSCLLLITTLRYTQAA